MILWFCYLIDGAVALYYHLIKPDMREDTPPNRDTIFDPRPVYNFKFKNDRKFTEFDWKLKKIEISF